MMLYSVRPRKSVGCSLRVGVSRIRRAAMTDVASIPVGRPEDFGFTARIGGWDRFGKHWKISRYVWQHCGVDARVTERELRDTSGERPVVWRVFYYRCPVCGVIFRCGGPK
jgi:hypothetical protein